MAVVLLFGLFAGAAVLFTLALAGLVVGAFVRLLLFPLFLIKWIVTAVVMLVVGPVLAIVSIALALAFGLVVAIPLLPLVVVGTLLWLLVRSTRRPAVV